VTASEDGLKALMLRGLDGDAGAHRELLGHLAILLRAFYARRMGREAVDLEDLVQETLVAVHTRRMTFSREQLLTPWVYAVARYKLIDHLRRGRHRVTEPLEAAYDVAEPDAADAATAGADLARLMAALPAKQRDAIRFVKVEGLSVAEAAVRSGQSESAIKVGIHRGLKVLMKRVRGGAVDAD
jgi:RNA polymerase sigma-70 factor, ECF subfamily